MKKVLNIIIIIVLGGCLSLANAATLNLTQTPLFAASFVPPNIFFELDDSGSMDWEMSVGSYWNFCAYDPNATGVYSLNPICGSYGSDDGLIRSYANFNYRSFTYMFANNDNLYSDSCSSDTYNAIESCSSAGTKEWRVYSADLNSIYYDPSSTFTPWIGPCLTVGTACANASFTAARSNPDQSQSGYTATRNLSGSVYEVWIDDRGFNPSDQRPLRALSVNATATPNGIIDLWDSHVRVQLNSSNAQVYSITYNPNTLGLNATQTLKATLSSTTACYNVLGNKDLVTQVFNGSLAYTSTGQPGCRTLTEAQTNFANWYQYSRRRSFVAKNAIGSVINRFGNYRYGLNVINNSLFIPMPSNTDYATQNQNLVNSLYGFTWQALGTPLRTGLARAGQYYNGTLSNRTSPIIYPCQQNFTILVTDGFWNDTTGPSYVGDSDRDGISQTLADVARYYYITDLSSLANQVLPTATDPATYQHMVTFTIGFNINGLLVDTDGDGWPDPPLAVNGNWGNPFNSDAEKVDDLWHAAFNSKGSYLSAQSAASIATALNNVFATITARSSSAAPAAQNSTLLNSSSQVFQALFNTNNWTGDLLAYNIGVNNQLGTTPSWSASCALTGGTCNQTSGTTAGIAANNRVIITRNWTGANNGIAFRWPSNYTSYKVSNALPTNLANFLSQAPYPANTTTTTQISANQAYGQQLLNYLRGDRTQETQYGGSYSFRDRTSILGDIVDSAPIYVGPPGRTYPDTMETAPYSSFVSSYRTRLPLVYVGANDGMLHAFSATDGTEKMSYISGSSQIFQNLPYLSIAPYQHVYFNDGSPIDADVFYNSAWHTIIASGLGNGGQSLYALDVTNPNNFTEANAANIYLFEFSDVNDPDFGYVQGQPVIAKVRTGVNQSKWAIIVNNGYNSTVADGNASTTGRAALFILFIEQGANGTWVADQSYIKIPVGPTNLTTPNGLSTPYAVDVDGDYIVDYVYAGDLKGNMWKFDLRNTTPTNWKNNATLLFTASNTTAGDQPITAPPVVGAHPNGLNYGVMVYFGTGKYLELADNTTSNQSTQSFYGIWDKLQGATVAKSSLVQQQVLAEVTSNSNTYRVVSSNALNWSTNLGWYLNLYVNSSNNGERQISQPILRNGNVIFTTMAPSSNPCDYGGSSWLMEMDAATGGAPLFSPFDTNNDGTFSQQDYLTVTISGQTLTVKAAGVKSASGITGTPTVLVSSDKTKEVKVTSGSQGLSTVIENPGSNSGRQNWRQIY